MTKSCNMTWGNFNCTTSARHLNWGGDHHVCSHVLYTRPKVISLCSHKKKAQQLMTFLSLDGVLDQEVSSLWNRRCGKLSLLLCHLSLSPYLLLWTDTSRHAGQTQHEFLSTCCSRCSWRGWGPPVNGWSDCPLWSPCCSCYWPPRRWWPLHLRMGERQRDITLGKGQEKTAEQRRARGGSCKRYH